MYLGSYELRTPKLPYCLILFLSLFITLLSLSSFVLSLSLSLPRHTSPAKAQITIPTYVDTYLVGDFPPKTLLVVIIRGAAFSSQYAPKNSRLSWTSLRHRGRTAPYRVLGMFGKLWRAPGYAKPVPRGRFAFLFPLPLFVKGK